MTFLQYTGIGIAIWAIADVCIFLLTHFMVQRGKSVVISKIVAVIAVAGLVWLLLSFVTTPAHAQGIVEVAQCTIDANNRLPYGPELKAAERKCYQILPQKVAEDAYKNRGTLEKDYQKRMVIEVRCGPRSLGTVPTPLARC